MAKFLDKIKKIFTNKEGKAPVFWLAYGGGTLLGVLVLVLLMVKLQNYLEAFEETRPVHEADRVVESIFKTENREALKVVLTNKVENDVETIDEVLDTFYKTIEGKELTFGRFFGQYSDEKPQYIVSADDKQIAYFTLKETKRYNKLYQFKLWEVESVTLTTQSKYSYAVTIPETMTLFINGIEIPKNAAKGHKDSDCMVGYSEYAGAGFYSQPEVRVVDRTGQEVILEKDEKTGAYYYLIHYAYAPSDTTVSFRGTVITGNEAMEKNIDSGIDFSLIKEAIKTYPEYQTLEDVISYPTFVKYYVDLYVDEEETVWTDRFGADSIATYDADSRTFRSGVESMEADREELVSFATTFLETYSLFCSRDKKIGELAAFFPENSVYYEKFSHLNNNEFFTHSNTSFINHEVKEYMGYSDRLVYVHIYLEQRMKQKSDSKWVNYPIDIPLWLVKIEDKWYIGSIDFNGFENGFKYE